MTVPSYTTDLQDIDLAQSQTGWAELTGHSSGGGDALEEDYFIQGTACISQSTGAADLQEAGLCYDYGSDMASSMSAGDCFFAWQIFLAANAVDTWANGGIMFGVGSGNGTGGMNYWNAIGKDFGRAGYGGWQNNAIDPTYTPDQVDGTPSAGVYQYFGSMPYINSAVSKGNPHGVDAIRYGRGELIVEYGETADYATFAGIAAKNDANDVTDGYNRWGLFQEQFGSYLWKGLISLGNATNPVDFRDSNRTISVDDCPRTYADFNKIEINNASSRVDWTNIQITSLASGFGVDARGNFEAVADADINFDTCVFTDMGTFIFDSISTVLTSTFRRCNLVTTGGGVFTGCTFDDTNDTTKAVLAASTTEAAAISGSEFISGGTGYGLEITGAAGDFTFTDVTWSGYALQGGTAANRAIHITAVTGTFNITVSGGTAPTYHSEGATVNINSDVTTTFTGMKDNSEVRVYKVSDDSVVAGIEDATAGSPDDRSFAWAAPVATEVYYIIHCFQPGATIYETIRVESYTVPSDDVSIAIQQRIDRNAEN